MFWLSHGVYAYESRLERENPFRREVLLTKGEMGSALAGAIPIEREGFWTKLQGN